MIAVVYLAAHRPLRRRLRGLRAWSGFDALGHAMAAIATGGFSSHDAGFGYWDSAAARVDRQPVHAALAAMPFFLYVHLLRGDWRPLAHGIQVRLFVVLIAVGVLLLAALADSRASAWRRSRRCARPPST